MKNVYVLVQIHFGMCIESKLRFRSYKPECIRAHIYMCIRAIVIHLKKDMRPTGARDGYMYRTFLKSCDA